MKPPTAVVLAAGRGMRLAPATDFTPKPLVPVAGRPILQHIFSALSHGAGVRHFVVVVGYRASDFEVQQPPAGCTVTRVENARWADTNSMASLALGIPYLAEYGGFIVEGDCCFDARLFDAQAAEDAWYVRPFAASDDGCCLWSQSDGLIRRLSIESRGGVGCERPWQVWKSCGVLRVGARLSCLMSDWLKDGLSAGRERDYYDLILRDRLDAAKLHVANIGDARWFEIDSASDLAQAEALFRSGER